jgi:hypothetical protein
LKYSESLTDRWLPLYRSLLPRERTVPNPELQADEERKDERYDDERY